MIITSTKKKKPHIVDNIQKLVDSAGETQFKNIYKNLQTEIKDKIITKLLKKVDIQNKQIEKYKEEILSLKNDLVYLLKRVIISKIEEKINSPNSKLNKNYNKLNNNFSSSTHKYDTSTFSPSNNISSQLNTFSKIFKQTENNNIINTNINNKISFDTSNIYSINNPQSEIDIKITNYINSIYKHNFVKNETNINDYYSLNKKENIFEEIFQKKMNNKNNDLHIGTDPCYNKKYHLHNNRSQRNISSSTKTKRPNESIEERRKNKKLSSSMINIKKKYEYMTDYNEEFEENKDNENDEDNLSNIKGKINLIIKNNNSGNKYLKVKKKNEEINNENENKLTKIKSFKNKTNGLYSFTGINKSNHNTTLKKKIKKNNHFIPLSRSPFLANKF